MINNIALQRSHLINFYLAHALSMTDMVVNINEKNPETPINKDNTCLLRGSGDTNN